MRVLKRLFVKGVIVVLAANLLVACGGKEERKASYLERGKAYLEEKNYQKAAVEFKNVLQIDPKTAEAFLHLGVIEEKRQNWSSAFANYKKAVELGPDLVEPRVRLARVYLAQAAAMRAREDTEGLANAMGLVQEQIGEILNRDPSNLEGLSLQAALWVNDGDLEKAQAQLESVLEKDPGLKSAAVLLSGIYRSKKREDDAETTLLGAIKSTDDALLLQQRLAQLYQAQKRDDKVEEVLRKIVADDPDELSHRISLASFLTQSEQLDKAEQVLRETLAADPDDVGRYLLLSEFLAVRRGKETAISEMKAAIAGKPGMSELEFGLVKLYLSNSQPDKAKQNLQNMINEHGVSPAGLKARVTLAQLLASEDKTSARVPLLVNEVLAENPRDNDALLLKGKLAANAGDFVEAIANFRSVLRDQPNSAEVVKLLSAAHVSNGEPELARDTLLRALENNSGLIDLRVALAQLYLADGQVRQSLEQVDAVLKINKNYEQALVLKYELLGLKGDVAGMEELVKLMQKNAPDKADGYLREARLRFAQKDYPAALALLDSILAKDANHLGALLAKSDILMAQKNYSQAFVVAERLQQAVPDRPEGFYRKAKLLEATSDNEAALQQYELALAKAPDSVEVLTAFTSLEMKHGSTEKAQARLEGIIADNPRHRSANELLGLVYLSSGDYAKAKAALERQIAISPKGAVVYSQLAKVSLAEDDLQAAVAVYERGLSALADNARLLIEFAGVREKQGDFEAAIALYEKVLDKQPGNAVSVNNLAALLSDYRSDPASLAKAVELAGLLENTSQPAFLDTAAWVYYRKGDFAKAVDILKGVVKSAPKVPVFRYHLGMAYLKQGDKAAAREQLLLATDGEYRYSGIEEARKTLAEL